MVMAICPKAAGVHVTLPVAPSMANPAGPVLTDQVIGARPVASAVSSVS